MPRSIVRLIASGALLTVMALPAGAQQPLRLSIQDGRVTLHAQNVPVRAILAEWSRIGGTTVFGGDRIAEAPVTLDLNGVPERQVLDILLRNVAGYVLGARASAAGGASSYDRILILPTSVAPRAAVAPASNTPIRRPPPLPPGRADDDPQQDDAPEPSPTLQPGRVLRTAPVDPSSQPNVPQQFGQSPFQPDPDDSPSETRQPGLVTVEPGPGNPFGVPAGSSSTPGVVTPVPQRPQTPQAPPQRVQDPN
jgi:hypothetical protein